MINVQVKQHKRTLASGKTVTVHKHKRGLNSSSAPFSNSKGVFHLPVRTAIIVPSTSNTDKRVSPKEFRKRISETRNFLSNTNGGFTSVKATGGFTDNKGNVVKEKVAVVESFSTKSNYRKKKKLVEKYLRQKAKAWKQDSMGYEHEDDLYYVEAKK